VIHTTVSTRASADARFRSPTGGASPTYMIDVDGTIYQYVRETDAPWTNGTMVGQGSNLDSITVENVDNGKYNSPRDPRQLEALAQLLADVHRRRAIPLVHRGKGGGVLGHRECEGANTACPDSLLQAFPAILARANAIANPPKPVPAPTPAPPPDDRPEWLRNLAPAEQTVQLHTPVPLRDMTTGAAVGSVPAGPLTTTYITHVGTFVYRMTHYAKDHNTGRGIPEVAIQAAIAPPTPAPKPPPATSPSAGPVEPSPAPSPPDPGPVPTPPPGTMTWLQSLLDFLRKLFGGS
jgi:hypothetical protein